MFARSGGKGGGRLLRMSSERVGGCGSLSPRGDAPRCSPANPVPSCSSLEAVLGLRSVRFIRRDPAPLRQPENPEPAAGFVGRNPSFPHLHPQNPQISTQDVTPLPLRLCGPGKSVVNSCIINHHPARGGNADSAPMEIDGWTRSLARLRCASASGEILIPR